MKKQMELDKAVRRLKEKPVRLHLGSGDAYFEDWINCDLANDKADVKLDCSKISLPDNSVQEVYSSHLIEHFDFRQGQEVIKEWYRVLMPGGKITLETPDLLGLCQKFVNGNEQERINLYGLFFAQPWTADWNLHKFLYSETQLRWTLEKTGFRNVTRIDQGDIVYLKLEALKEKPKEDWQSKVTWRHPLSTGWFVHQKPTELIMLSDFLKGNKIKKVLEIGSANGGTAIYWANMVGDDGVVYSVDTEYVGRCYKGTEFEKQIIEMIGDSHDPFFKKEITKTVGKIDMLFIDGDHSYEGVKDDFNSFYPLVRKDGFIILHDIVDSEYHRERGCFVATFWNEIKGSKLLPIKTFEFIDPREFAEVNTPALSMGIGVILKEK